MNYATEKQRNSSAIIFSTIQLHCLSFGWPTIAVEQKLEKVVPKKFKVDVHHWLILHGRYVCTAHKPKCGSCIIEDCC